LIGHYPSHRVILFSLVADNQLVHDHVNRGGTAYIRNNLSEDDRIERLDRDSGTPVISIAQLPSGENGLFPQNIANAMAAAALSEGMAIPIETVRVALRTFRNSLEQSPGRFNMLEGYSQTILLDNAIHVPSCAALINSLEGMNVSGRRICMYETMGNRPDWHYTELGETLGPHFDRFICYDHVQHRRGRAPGEIPDLLKAGLINAGVSPDCVDTARGYTDATKELMRVVGDNDLVVILTGCAYRFLPVFLENFRRTGSGNGNNRDVDGQGCC
jgi:cyanophycin synthetase